MSTIMKALKKLEKERTSERDRPLRDEVLASAPQRRSTAGGGIARMILGAVLGVLASAALLGAWLLWGGDLGIRPVEITISEPLVPPPLTLAEVKPLPPVAESSQKSASPPTGAPPQPVERVAARTEPARPLTQPVTSPVESEPIPSEPEPTLEEKELLVDALLEEALAAEAARRIEAHQVSVAFSVQRTVWHPQAAQREAFIRIPPDDTLQRVREGDVIGSAVVLSIEPAAVVLEREGVETRKRVGAP